MVKYAHFEKPCGAAAQISAISPDLKAPNLPSSTNVTILEGLHSETISVGVAMRRDSPLAAHAVPEMGDADQRRGDEVIKADLEVAFPVDLPVRSGGAAR